MRLIVVFHLYNVFEPKKSNRFLQASGSWQYRGELSALGSTPRAKVASIGD